MEICNQEIDIYVDNFMAKLNEIYCYNFPLKFKEFSKNKLNNKWMTPEILHLIDLKAKYFSLYNFPVTW